MTRKASIYYYEFYRGYCGLRAGHSLSAVKKELLSQFGSDYEASLVRLATKEDIAWVTGMGGYLPKEVSEKCGK